MSARLTIGQFSQMTQLSVRTLRRYHDTGLLEPAEVDRSSGYRYYRPQQIPVAQTVRRLRELDLPLAEIRTLLGTTDDAARADLLGRHLERLEAQLERTRESVVALRRLLGTDDALPVERRRTTDLVVAAVRVAVTPATVLVRYSAAMAELADALAAHGVRADGPPGALLDNAVFTDDAGDLTLYLPVDRPPTSGRVAPFVVPAADLAVTVHHGSHADIDVTYGRLGAWVAENGLGIDGPVHERYLVGPRDTPEPDAWRTEIGWPVRRDS